MLFASSSLNWIWWWLVSACLNLYFLTKCLNLNFWNFSTPFRHYLLQYKTPRKKKTQTTNKQKQTNKTDLVCTISCIVLMSFSKVLLGGWKWTWETGMLPFQLMKTKLYYAANGWHLWLGLHWWHVHKILSVSLKIFLPFTWYFF